MSPNTWEAAILRIISVVTTVRATIGMSRTYGNLSDHLILSRYVCSNIVANIVSNIYMYVMRHVRM